MKFFLFLFSVFWMSQSPFALLGGSPDSTDDGTYTAPCRSPQSQVAASCHVYEEIDDSHRSALGGYAKPYDSCGDAYQVTPVENLNSTNSSASSEAPLICKKVLKPQVIQIDNHTSPQAARVIQIEDDTPQQNGWRCCKKTLFWFSGFIPGSLAGAAALLGGAYVYAMQNPDILFSLAHYFGANDTQYNALQSELEQCRTDLRNCHLSVFR